jgi:hypothetical protein
MKNKIIYMLIFTTMAAHGEDLYYRVLRDTGLYEYITSTTFDSSTKNNNSIRQGNEVILHEDNGFYPTVSKTENGNNVMIGVYSYSGDDYFMVCNDLIPRETEDTFALSFLSELNSDDRKTWVPAYYADVLRSLERDSVLKHEPYWAERYDPYERYIVDVPWYECFAGYLDTTDCLYIANSVILVNSGIDKLVVKNINKTDSGYFVNAKRLVDKYKFDSDSLDWSYVEGKELFNVILHIDGDYMDVYLEDMRHKLQTYIFVDQRFLKEMQNLLAENRADLSGIIWPRRADGSMDYPPPQPAQASVTEQPETADVPPADYGEAAESDPVEETVGQQSGARFPWVIVLVIAGIALVGGGLTAFVVLRKKK